MSNAETKSRKVVDGAIRNKERSRQRWIDAVGEVLREKGYTGLTIRNITEKAGLDRRLISIYFGDVNNLIDTYLNSQDYWMAQVAPKIGAILGYAVEIGPDVIISILHTLLDSLDESPDLQKILGWEVSSYHPVLRSLADSREEMAMPMYQSIDQNFTQNALTIKGILALQIAGIYYLVLHGKNNGSTFCEIDIKTSEGKQAIKDALSTIVHLLFTNLAVK